MIIYLNKIFYFGTIADLIHFVGVRRNKEDRLRPLFIRFLLIRVKPRKFCYLFYIFKSKMLKNTNIWHNVINPYTQYALLYNQWAICSTNG